MKTCKLIILDQVNCRFDFLDGNTRRAINQKLSFVDPKARFSAAYKLKRWDGRISYCTLATSATYINLIEQILPIIIDAGYEIEIEDHRSEEVYSVSQIDENFLSDFSWGKGHKYEGEKIVLASHQVDILNGFFEHGQGVCSASVGAGKTIICCAISKAYQQHGRVLIIVPSKNLALQTERDYINLGMDVGVYYDKRKDSGHQNMIVTWQSLVAMVKNRSASNITAEEFIKDVNCIIVDECHTVCGKELKGLLHDLLRHVPVRFGMSGTIPKEDFNFNAILGTLGPVVGEITTAELQKNGFLASCEIDIVQLQDKGVHFKKYPDEKEWLHSDENRMAAIASFINKLEGNVLILVTPVEFGRSLSELIDGATFISGITKTEDREKEFAEFTDDTRKKLVATYGVCSVGVSISEISKIAIIEPGKSFIKTIQSLGRGLRKSKMKGHCTIYDICSGTLKYSKRHSGERKKIYKEAKFKYTETKLDY